MLRRSCLVAICVAVSPALASPIEAPCDGCEVAIPDSQDPVPLLVVLHGDNERARTWLDRWHESALYRGWAVLALQCPEQLGCRGASWYSWDGDPRWVIRQV